MKTTATLLAACFLFAGFVSRAQTTLAPDQNPNYAISRDKYMGMADSLNRWHGTTLQNTYEAYDFMAAREKARRDRSELRRMLRLERARWSDYDYRYDGYYNPYYNNYNHYYPYNSNQDQRYRWQRPRFWWW